MKKEVMKQMICAMIAGAVVLPMGHSLAAEKDIDAQIAEQQQILQRLNEQKNDQQNKDLQNQLDKLDQQLRDLREKPSYDAKGAIDAIASQIIELRKQLDETASTQLRIVAALDKFEQRAEKERLDRQKSDDARVYSGTAATRNYLVNPGPNQKVSYTQDAINSQGNSTQIFAYGSNQLYKIYCRKGFLTDLTFKKGEKITFVGGGDTAAWLVNNTEVDGVPHLYIKPVVDSSTTNLIVTTTKHSYQIILNTSDWYNPMVTWTYEAEDRNNNMIQQKKDERITTGKVNASHVEDLDFNYTISGNSSEKPVMVFSDAEQTYIKFKKTVKNMPLFIREKGKRELALVNYRIKDNYYIVEKIFDMAQLRVSDNEVIMIKHK